MTTSTAPSPPRRASGQVAAATNSGEWLTVRRALGCSAEALDIATFLFTCAEFPADERVGD